MKGIKRNLKIPPLRFMTAQWTHRNPLEPQIILHLLHHAAYRRSSTSLNWSESETDLSAMAHIEIRKQIQRRMQLGGTIREWALQDMKGATEQSISFKLKSCTRRASDSIDKRFTHIRDVSLISLAAKCREKFIFLLRSIKNKPAGILYCQLLTGEF